RIQIKGNVRAPKRHPSTPLEEEIALIESELARVQTDIDTYSSAINPSLTAYFEKWDSLHRHHDRLETILNILQEMQDGRESWVSPEELASLMHTPKIHPDAHSNEVMPIQRQIDRKQD